MPFGGNLKYSIVNGKRTDPFPKGRGKCPVCGNETQAKCGKKTIWHWSHRPSNNCDAWWENETEWHRNWKNHWPIENQEVVQFDDRTGEKHIADVKNNSGIVIELQNSPIDDEELLAREDFYKNMVWVVNGLKFKKNIRIGTRLPDPEAEDSKDLCIYDSMFPSGYFIFHKNSDRRPDSNLVEVHGSEKIQEFVDSTHCGHYLFSWKRKRSVWFSSTKTVFFDFGENLLWKLVKFNQCSPFCFQAYSKQDVIRFYGGRWQA